MQSAEKKPAVSVIVPAYNAEATLNRCIESILAQTLADIEIIIIDDGSRDQTPALADEAAKRDGRIRVVHKKNEGQGIARNVGMALARGEYIGFVDSDDTIEKAMYEAMLKAARADGADVVQCNIMNVFKDGRRVIQLPKTQKTVRVADRKDYFDSYIFRPVHSYECCNKLIRKDFLSGNEILFDNNERVYAEDLLFNLDMARLLHTIVFIDNPFYFYYQYDDSHSKRNSAQKIDRICVLFGIFAKRAPELLPEISQIAVLIIMINLSHIIHTKEGLLKARELFAREDIKTYLRQSFFKMEKPHAKLLMLVMRYMPFPIKALAVRLYYTNLK